MAWLTWDFWCGKSLSLTELGLILETIGKSRELGMGIKKVPNYT